jgi:chemotaxis protein MotA
MQMTPLLGSIIAVISILLGQWIGGGHALALIQPGSFIVVLGATAGAVLLAFPMSEIRRALARISDLYHFVEVDHRALVQEIIKLAETTRKEGILAIEGKRAFLANRHLSAAIRYVSEGVDPAAVKEILASEIQIEFDELESSARVFETAGAYAPTIGVVGAILGLIQVMAELSDPAKIGIGITGAFVAMIYGVGLSSLLLVPWSTRTRRIAERQIFEREIVRAGVIGIQEGLSPQFLEEKLQVFLSPDLGKRGASASIARHS